MKRVRLLDEPLLSERAEARDPAVPLGQVGVRPRDTLCGADGLDRRLLGIDPRLPCRVEPVQRVVAHRLNHIGPLRATPARHRRLNSGRPLSVADANAEQTEVDSGRELEGSRHRRDRPDRISRSRGQLARDQTVYGLARCSRPGDEDRLRRAGIEPIVGDMADIDRDPAPERPHPRLPRRGTDRQRTPTRIGERRSS